MKPFPLILTGLLVAAGVAAAGWFAGAGFEAGREGERFVTVKGVSERDVEADQSVWQLSFVATHEELGPAQQQIQESRGKIAAFLERHGIAKENVELQAFDVTDRLADPYQQGGGESRFIVKATLAVHTSEPLKVKAAAENIGQVVEEGVVITAPYGPYSGPTYLYTKLNDVKPEMIAEATRRARESALKFAADSGAQLGNIRRANQGVFEILPRTQSQDVMQTTEFHKTVRVVVTIDYLLAE